MKLKFTIKLETPEENCQVGRREGRSRSGGKNFPFTNCIATCAQCKAALCALMSTTIGEVWLGIARLVCKSDHGHCLHHTGWETWHRHGISINWSFLTSSIWKLQNWPLLLHHISRKTWQLINEETNQCIFLSNGQRFIWTLSHNSHLLQDDHKLAGKR